MGRGTDKATFEFGLADLSASRRTERNTLFHLFSGTKLFTATALMLLRERGLVDLDAEVRTYLPQLDIQHPITLRQLASHSSGLPDTLRAFLAIHFLGDAPPTTASALSRYRTSKGRPAGKKAAYRNVNYAILGEVITRVSGLAYTEFVQQDVLRPLKVEAAFDYDEHGLENVAVGTIPRCSPMRWLLRFLTPNAAVRMERARAGSVVSLAEFSLDTAAIGGLIGRATDFLPLATEMLSTEDGLLSAESKREMLTLQARGQAGIASAEGVGIGWKFGRRDGVEFWNHEGGGAGFTSEMRIYPAEDVAVVLMMNATQTKRLSWLAHEICEGVRKGELLGQPM